MKIIYVLYALIVIIFIASLIPLYYYFTTFDGGISTEPIEWSTFGTIMGAVSGSLAFIVATTGILVTRHESAKAQQSDTFFKLLDLHLKKVDAVVVNGKSGYEAFKFFADKANKYLLIHLAIQKIKQEDKKSMDRARILVERTRKCIDFNFRSYNPAKAVIEILIKDYHDALTLFEYEDQFNDWEKWIADYVKSLSVDDRRKALAEVYKQIYTEDGHLLGQYFRNMYYTMKTFNEFDVSEKKKDYYGKLYRAQLGKSELVLGLFNAVWERSGKEMVELLLQYDMLDDIYSHDIILFTGLDTEQAYKQTKEILNSYLDLLKEEESKVTPGEAGNEA